jgi:hypothetical protein
MGYDDGVRSEKVDAAFAVYSSLLTINERVHGPDALEVAEIVDKMGCIKGNQGDLVEANTLFARAHPIYMAHYGPTSSMAVAAAANIEASKAASVAASGNSEEESTKGRFQMHSVVFLAMAVAEGLDRLATNAGVLLCLHAGGRRPSTFSGLAISRSAADRWLDSSLAPVVGASRLLRQAVHVNAQ